jgi:hypothetical protein
MKEERYIPPVPVRFVQGEIYIHLFLIDELSDTVIRGYVKDRNMCFFLDLLNTLHSAASWINQDLVLFMTVINTDL